MKGILLPPLQVRPEHYDRRALLPHSCAMALGHQEASPPPHRIEDETAPHPLPPTCQGLHGGLVMSAQQLCLDGLHDSLEPTARTWKGQGNRMTWRLTGTRKALPPCRNWSLHSAKDSPSLGLNSPPLLKPDSNPWFGNGAKNVDLK